MEDNETIRFKRVYISNNVIFAILLLGQGQRGKFYSRALFMVSLVSLME